MTSKSPKIGTLYETRRHAWFHPVSENLSYTQAVGRNDISSTDESKMVFLLIGTSFARYLYYFWYLSSNGHIYMHNVGAEEQKFWEYFKEIDVTV